MEAVTSRPMLMGIVARIVASGRKRYMHLTSTHADDDWKLGFPAKLRRETPAERRDAAKTREIAITLSLIEISNFTPCEHARILA